MINFPDGIISVIGLAFLLAGFIVSSRIKGAAELAGWFGVILLIASCNVALSGL